MRRPLSLLALLCAVCALAAPTVASAATTSHTTTRRTTTHKAGATKHHKRGTSVSQGNAVINDCQKDGQLNGTYTKAELRKALQIMSPSVKQYSNCQDVIQQALLGKSGGGSGGSDTGGGGGTGTIIIIVVVVVLLIAVVFGGLAIRRRRMAGATGADEYGDTGHGSEDPTRVQPPDDGR